MRRLLLFPMLFLAMVLVSCSDDDATTTAKTSSMTFNVTTPQLPTKAVNITRYIMAIYTLDDPNTVLHRIEQASGTFTLELERNTSYVCLFWADETALNNNADGTYDASDLKNVTLNDGKEMAEAFFTRLDVATAETTFDVTLKRPIAQVNIVEIQDIEANSVIVITHDHHTSFNTFTSDVAESAVSKSITITPSVTTGKLGSYYTFAPVAGHLKDFTAVYNSYLTNAIPNIPLKANFVTNINGYYAGGTLEHTFIIEIDEEWEGEFDEWTFVSGIAVNVGTESEPKWIEIADRNAEKGGPNGGTEGNTALDYGSFYWWSSATSSPTEINGCYSACFNFMEGNGAWRIMIKDEWLSLAATTSDGSRRMKYEDDEWKLYDERTGKENDFIYFPKSGYRSSTGNISNVGNAARFWMGDMAYHFYMINNSISSGYTPPTTRLSIRCVRDIDTPN